MALASFERSSVKLSLSLGKRHIYDLTALPDRIEVVFDDLQRAPTPGQSLVLYDDERVLGGGVIDQT